MSWHIRGNVTISSYSDTDPTPPPGEIEAARDMRLGRMAARHATEPRLRYITGALGAAAFAATAVLAIGLQGRHVAANPEASNMRQVTLHAVTANGQPYNGPFAVDITGPGGVQEELVGFIPVTHPYMLAGNDTLETREGDIPGSDIDPGAAVGPVNVSHVTVTQNGQGVTVVVPLRGPDTNPALPNTSAQDSSGENPSVSNNDINTVQTGNMTLPVTTTGG